MDPLWPFYPQAPPATDFFLGAGDLGDPLLVSPSPATQQLGPDGIGPAAPTSSGSVPTSGIRLNLPSVPAACLSCRGKHLKCDGQRPCSRCFTSNIECVYVASRRGYRGPRRRPAVQNRDKRVALLSSRETTADASGGMATVGTSSYNLVPSTTAAFDPHNAIFSGTSPFSQFISQTSAPDAFSTFTFECPFDPGLDALDITFGRPVPRMLPLRERYIDSFYHHFHGAHPFVLPKDHLLLLAKDGTIEPLLAAVRWVGSLFVEPGTTSHNLFKEAYRLVYDPKVIKDGFLVQAMVLLVIGLDGNRQRKKVKKLLAESQNLSVQIGLNTRLFASLNGQGMPMLEESWRRTWWELYIVDALIAGVHRATKFVLYSLPADVALPCEEYQYLSGHIPRPSHLEDMDKIGFLDGGQEFSSFAYRIQGARILGRLQSGHKAKHVAQIEALLSNWRLHLPSSKQDVYQSDGHLDEMLFQAHMMIHAISILLHQPYSQLDPSPTRNIDACAPNTPALSGDAFNGHTKHTIQSAHELSKLVTHRVSLLSHTHFFAYMVTLSSTIHLSNWSLAFVPQNDDHLRQSIRLNLGALIKYSEIWPAAQHLGMQVKAIAQQVYWMKKDQQLPPPQWGGLATQEEVTSSTVASESIPSEGETIQTTLPYVGQHDRTS